MSDPDLPSAVRGAAPDGPRPPAGPGPAQGRSVSARVLAVVALALAAAGVVAWLDVTRDAQKPFNGEDQIEKTLTSNPLKLYLDVDSDFDPIREDARFQAMLAAAERRLAADGAGSVRA